MSEPTILIQLAGREFEPGETISGEYSIDGLHPCQIKAVEVSVLWYTEGKGDEDMAVHEFWRFADEESDRLDRARSHTFSAQLPRSPLSYEGEIVKIRWCVRVRAFLHRGKHLMAQRAFRLGHLPPVRLPALGNGVPKTQVEA